MTDKAIFDNLENLVTCVNLVALAENHLQQINYNIKGYYDEKEYYENIYIPKDIKIEVEEVTTKYTKFKNKYTLAIVYRLINLGELTLIYDKQGNFIDEKWDLVYNLDEFLKN